MPGSVISGNLCLSAVAAGTSGGAGALVMSDISVVSVVCRRRRGQLAAPFDPVEAGTAASAAKHHLGCGTAEQRYHFQIAAIAMWAGDAVKIWVVRMQLAMTGGISTRLATDPVDRFVSGQFPRP